MSIVNQETVCLAEQPSRIKSIRGRIILSEAIGALGDMGTFAPIVLGLVVLVGMDAATVLVFAGLANIVTGLVFKVPIAVQPMKAIAALAIAGTMAAHHVSVAGILVGLSLLVLASAGLIEQLDRVIPRSVIRGIQLAVATKLALKASSLGLFDQATLSLRPVHGAESLTVLGIAVAVLLLFRRRPQRAALALVLMGFIIATAREPAMLNTARITLWQPRLLMLDGWAVAGSLKGALAQMPLTLLNSVFAVSLLAGKLFPIAGGRTTPTRMAVSVGLTNLLSCPFGAMPVCHGSGGLAGQYAFGARSGLSMVMLGTAKLAIGLLFGSVALAWMLAFPVTVLAVFLLLAGVTLAQASRFWKCQTDLAVGIVTVGVYFGTGFLPAGFAAGWATYAFCAHITKILPVDLRILSHLAAKERNDC